MNLLQVSGLCKRYPSFELKDVSFSVEEGQIMGFIGRNGAGKSTTLKCLLNFVHPDQGDIRFFGLPLAQAEQEIKQQIGFLNGGVDYYLSRKLKVITDVTKSFYPTWDQKVYEGYMRRFELDENKTPSQLSAGMRVKYNLALSLSHGARLLILDEPTSGLDPISRDELLEIFIKLAKTGVSILFSTHIISDLQQCADAITYIRKGKIVQSTSLKQFAAEYALCQWKEGEISEETQAALIGVKMAKEGYTALVKACDAQKLMIAAKPASLEEIMIHLEREGEREDA